MAAKTKKTPVFYRLKDKAGKWIDHERAKDIVAAFEGKAPDPVGKIHPAKSLFLREGVGTAKNGKLEYEMTTIYGDRAPLVMSKKSGKYFSLSWSNIIDLAILAGIDEPETAEKKAAPMKSEPKKTPEMSKDKCLECGDRLTAFEAESYWCNRCGGGYCNRHYDDALTGGHGCRPNKAGK